MVVEKEELEHMINKEEIKYKVTYSRTLGGNPNRRLIATDVEVSEKDFKDMVNSPMDSRYNYIIISCEMIDPDFSSLNSVVPLPVEDFINDVESSL